MWYEIKGDTQKAEITDDFTLLTLMQVDLK
jgi:hypothetical protein